MVIIRKPNCEVPEEEDAGMNIFCSSKINLVKEKINTTTTAGFQFRQSLLEEAHNGGHRACSLHSHSVEDFGIPTSVFYRLKLQNTFNRINKNCEVNERSSTYRDEIDEMALRDYLKNKRALLVEQLTANRLEAVSLAEYPLVVVGEIARFATFLQQQQPEEVMQLLLKPLNVNQPLIDQHIAS